jgi:HSP20 family protein
MNNLAKQQNEPAVAAEPARYYTTPLVDVVTHEEGYVLRAEMPGVTKDGVEITVENGHLTILGHRRPLEVAGERIYGERRGHDYRRVYELDPSIDGARVSAKMDHGVLTVTLPKAESVKPRRITLE